MRFTPAQIATIRTLRGSKVPWPVIAKRLKATIMECRRAIGLPTYLTRRSRKSEVRISKSERTTVEKMRAKRAVVEKKESNARTANIALGCRAADPAFRPIREACNAGTQQALTHIRFF